ncbi:MAG: PQQ-like beta-propeller repeat protein, partial [Actinomycetota bacterium]|nr:PQQ-like beta-propeller repeat protein [Actinomycetota bacterium]
LDAATGQERWRAGPSNSDGLRVASDGVSVALTHTDVVILDAASGDEQGGATLARSGLAPPAVASGTAYVVAGETLEAFARPVS